MRNRLSQTHSLAHAFAVRANLSIRRRHQLDALQSSFSQFVHLTFWKAGNHQKRADEFAARETTRKRIKLRAVADFAKQFVRTIGWNAKHAELAARRPQ